MDTATLDAAGSASLSSLGGSSSASDLGRGLGGSRFNASSLGRKTHSCGPDEQVPQLSTRVVQLRPTIRGAPHVAKLKHKWLRHGPALPENEGV